MKAKRIHLHLPPKVVARLKVVKEVTGAASTVEVFRRALGLYDLVVHTVKSGGSIVIRHSDGTDETLALLDV